MRMNILGEFADMKTLNILFYDKSRTVFVVNVSNSPLFWVSNLHTDSALYTFYSEYVELYDYFRDLLTLIRFSKVSKSLK